jgi:hypothetical protein
MPEPIRPMWSIKPHHIELMALRPTESGDVLPIVGCRVCGDQWRLQWITVWEYIPREIQARLRVYMEKSDPEFAATAEGKAA